MLQPQALPHVSPAIALTANAVLTVLMFLVGGGLLLAARKAAKLPKYRHYRRAMISFAWMSLLAGVSTIMQMALPLLAQEPYATWVNVAFLTLSAALPAYYLWLARGRYETGSLLVLFVPLVLLLIGDFWPKLPALPSLAELGATFAALCAVSTVPSWLAWRLLARRLALRWPPLFSLSLALQLTALWVACSVTMFGYLYWHGHHPANLPSAFAWAGAALGGMFFLNGIGITLYALYTRGRLQRWLSAEQPGMDTVLAAKILADPFHRQETSQANGVQYIVTASLHKEGDPAAGWCWMFWTYLQGCFDDCITGDSLQEVFEQAKRQGIPIETLTIDQWHS